MIRLFIVLATCLAFLTPKATAQILNDPRKLSTALKESPKLLIGLDSRRSFISDRDVKIMGIRVGLDFDKKARLGFGVYSLASPFQRTFILTNSIGIQDTVQSQLEFAYITAFFEYVVLATKHWEVSMPVHLGVGDVGFSQIPDEPQAFLLTEIGFLASYKIVPFFGLAGGLGYRQILAGGYQIRENFNAPNYSFGIKLWLGYLFEKFVLKKPQSS